MEKTVIFLLLFAAALAGGAGLSIFLIMRKLRQIYRSTFGTDSILEGLKKQEELIAETPKSVSAMTSIYLPAIVRDFPEFSYDEFEKRSENALKAMLSAIERQMEDGLETMAEGLKKQIRLRIEDNRRQKVEEEFHNVRIHRTAITEYEKKPGRCVIVFQSAVEYVYGKKQDGEAVVSEDRIQTRYDMEWIYIQDAEKISGSGKAVGLNCPNCGAPIKDLGAKTCDYCGLAVETINFRVWSLDHIKENA